MAKPLHASALHFCTYSYMQPQVFQGKAQRLCYFYTPLDLDKLIYEAEGMK